MRLLLAAATDWRTLIILGIGVAAAAALSNPFPVVIGLGVYLWAAQRLAHSPAFQAAAAKLRQSEALAARYKEMNETARAVLQMLSANRSWFIRVVETLTQGRVTARSWYDRATDVATAARQIYQEWLARPQEHAGKTPLVEQALQMATLYMRIIRGYHAISMGRAPLNLQEVEQRLARNQRRLRETIDQDARRDLMRAIEMDQRVLEQAAEEEAERERHQAKLAAIESTMDGLRRQIFSPESTGDAERLQEMLMEAEAMDQALDEVRHRTRVRAH